MTDNESRSVEDLAADLHVTVPEVLEAAKNFTTQPGALLDGPVPPKVASRIEAYLVTDMSTPTELRARADELESRMPPVTAGPRTDDERMWLEKATALRAEADQREADARVTEK